MCSVTIIMLLMTLVSNANRIRFRTTFNLVHCNWFYHDKVDLTYIYKAFMMEVLLIATVFLLSTNIEVKTLFYHVP